MIIDHSFSYTVLRRELGAIYQFFASQYSYGYSLTQENCYLDTKLSSRNSAEEKL